MSAALDLLVLATAWTHVFLAPYTKVEESFNLHAVHDVLMYGVRPNVLENYDHFLFPGAVPRTFLGSVLLAWLSDPVIRLAHYAGFVTDKFDLQIIVRLVLAALNTIGFCLMRRAISRRFGGPTSVLFVLLTCTQFHLPFWMGRTLPNMFALFPVNLGLYMLVNRAPRSMRPSQSSIHRAIILLTFTSAVFRSEVILLLGPLVLQSLICQWTTLTKVIKVGLIAGLFSAALTIGVDSYFWKRWPIWPELYSIYFNVIQGKSSEWGVSPFHTYFTSSLPKLLLSSLPLSLVGFMADSRVRALLLVPTTFLLLISGLSHKEWRFVVYTVPLFNIAAARGAAWMITRRKSTLFGRVCFLAVAGMLICNCLATTILTMASMENYPGGEALSKFNRIYATQEKVHVHISNLAAQTGASLFLHTHSPPYLLGLDIAPSTPHWTYNKTEHISPKLLTAAPEITHVIAEADAGGARASGFGPHVWTVVDAVDGFDKWMLNPNIKHLLKGRPADALDAVSHALVMNRSEKLLILERT